MLLLRPLFYTRQTCVRTGLQKIDTDCSDVPRNLVLRMACVNINTSYTVERAHSCSTMWSCSAWLFALVVGAEATLEASQLLNGTFTKAIRSADPSNCLSTNITYGHLIASERMEGIWRIPHSRIMMDGVRCGVLSKEATDEELEGDSYMDVFEYKHVMTKRGAGRARLTNAYLRLGAKGAVKELLMGLRASLGEERMRNEVIVGLEGNNERRCGKIVVPIGTFTIFARMGTRSLDISRLLRNSAGAKAILRKETVYHTIIAPVNTGKYRCCVYSYFRFKTLHRPIRACIPRQAMVRVKGARNIRVDNLLIGDQIAYITPDRIIKYSPLLFFSHRDPHISSFFIRIDLLSGDTLTLSPAHFIDQRIARDIRIGDRLRTITGSLSTVVRITHEQKRGLYNPQPASGLLIVDNVPITAYTAAWPPSSAHAALLPLRFLATHSAPWSGKRQKSVSNVSEIIENRIIPSPEIRRVNRVSAERHEALC